MKLCYYPNFVQEFNDNTNERVNFDGMEEKYPFEEYYEYPDNISRDYFTLTIHDGDVKSPCYDLICDYIEGAFGFYFYLAKKKDVSLAVPFDFVVNVLGLTCDEFKEGLTCLGISWARL